MDELVSSNGLARNRYIAALSGNQSDHVRQLSQIVTWAVVNGHLLGGVVIDGEPRGHGKGNIVRCDDEAVQRCFDDADGQRAVQVAQMLECILGQHSAKNVP